MRSKKNSDKRWSSSDAVKISISVLIFHTISFHVAEKNVHISSRLLVCVCTFLLVDKIVYGLLPFGDAWFSFHIQSFQDFRIINSLEECSASLSIFKKFRKIFNSGSFTLKNDDIHGFFFFSLFWLQTLNLPASIQNKNTRVGPFATEKEPIRAQGFA